MAGPRPRRLLAQRSSRALGSPASLGVSALACSRHRPLPDELTAAWLAPLRDGAIRADVLATLKAIDTRDTLEAAERLHEHPLPTLLAWAPEDPMFPLRFAGRLAAKIPGARLEQVPHSRAFVPWDQPARLADLIAAFVADSYPPGPALSSTARATPRTAS